jgi:YidC/Oxa1 family membrane protein insertase
MDRKTLVLVAACLLLVVFWWPIMDRLGLGRYNPAAYRPAPHAGDSALAGAGPGDGAVRAPGATDSSPAAARPGGAGAAGSTTAAPRPATLSALPFSATQDVIERTWTIETPLYRATFSNRGARLIAMELLHYAAAHGASNLSATGKLPHPGALVPEGDRVVLAGGPTFELGLGSGASLMSLATANYAVAESADAAGQIRALTFTAEDSAGMRVRQTWRVRPDSYALDLEVEIRRVPEALRLSDYSLTFRSWPLVTERDPAGEDRMLRACSMVGTKVYRDAAQGLHNKTNTRDGNVAWAGVQSHYFLAVASVAQGSARGVLASADQRQISDATLKLLPPGTKPLQNVAVNSLVMALPGESSPLHRFVVYLGPGDYHGISRLGLGQLSRAVDMGWGWLLPINNLLLVVLDWLFAVVRNYGLAIILLATLIRVLLHPLNMSSMKSMRAMQKLQPETERLRAKYKDDAQALNTAIMALYKENKVNPAGGCLPMLLQMPVLFSLFQVLSSAIQLRQAPFVGWMNDLSAPDVLFAVSGFPIHVLPIIMTGTGFLLQKMTPTSPQQAPTAYMMNAIMLFFFYSMPSGLVLYWTVMNGLSALQQWLVLRQDNGTAIVVRTGEDRPQRKKKG